MDSMKRNHDMFRFRELYMSCHLETWPHASNFQFVRKSIISMNSLEEWYMKRLRLPHNATRTAWEAYEYMVR